MNRHPHTAHSARYTAAARRHGSSRQHRGTPIKTHVFWLDVPVDDALGVALRHGAQAGAQEGGGGAFRVVARRPFAAWPCPRLAGARQQLAAAAQLQHQVHVCAIFKHLFQVGDV